MLVGPSSFMKVGFQLTFENVEERRTIKKILCDKNIYRKEWFIYSRALAAWGPTVEKIGELHHNSLISCWVYCGVSKVFGQRRDFTTLQRSW